MDLHLLYIDLAFYYNAIALVYHVLCFMLYKLLCMVVVSAV